MIGCSRDPAGGGAGEEGDGGPGRWAVIASSLLETAKLNGIEPCAYLTDVLERLTGGHPMSRIDDLLPWNWTAAAT